MEGTGFSSTLSGNGAPTIGISFNFVDSIRSLAMHNQESISIIDRDCLGGSASTCLRNSLRTENYRDKTRENKSALRISLLH